MEREELRTALGRIERIEEELSTLKRTLLLLPEDVERKEDVWAEWTRLGKETSRLWRGPGGVEEIREQREKPYSHASDS